VLTTAGRLLLHCVQFKGGTANLVDCVQDELQCGAILQHAPCHPCLVKQVLPLRSEVVNLVGRGQECVVLVPHTSCQSVLHATIGQEDKHDTYIKLGSLDPVGNSTERTSEKKSVRIICLQRLSYTTIQQPEH